MLCWLLLEELLMPDTVLLVDEQEVWESGAVEVAFGLRGYWGLQ